MYGAAIPPILAVIENVPIAVFLKKSNHICVKVAVIGDPYGMSIDMSASYLVLFNTLISSELKVEIRAGKSKSLIR